MDWVKELIPFDKFQTFTKLFQFPISTNEINEQVFGELFRVFDGRNPYFDYQFKSTELADDWSYYQNDVLKEKDIWENDGFEAFKNSINSIVVVDLPEFQEEARPNPYFYFLDISKVVSFEYGKDEFEWIVFEYKDKYAVIDDGYYRIFEKPENGELKEPEIEKQHDVGYCPVNFFWTESINKQNKYVKKSEISNQLTKLRWILFYEISKQHLDLYSSYPITWGYETDCDYEDHERQYSCDGGFLRDVNNNYVLNNLGVMQCPVCQNKRMYGAGSFVEVPTPKKMNMDGTEQPDMREPIGIVSYPVENLKYVVDELKRHKKEFHENVVGINSELLNSQAINKDQVNLSYESKQNVLIRIKKNFEKCQEWVDKTICKLRYGDSFISNTANWGTQFYIYTVSELQEKYKRAKENGVSEAELDMIADQIIETENRNNPTELQRALILKDLEPYRHKTHAELIELNEKGLIDRYFYLVKINFITFISKFERENMNIIEFGSLIPYNKKINIIKQTLLSYAKDETNIG